MAFPDRALCELCHRPCRGPRQGPGRIAQAGASRYDGLSPEVAAGAIEEVSSADLKPGDRVVVEAGQMIPGDGEIIEGIASVDESAITGESAPVIRAAGGDRSGVTGGTVVLSDRIVVRDHERRRRFVPRPDDRPGRGRHPPAKSERDRPDAAALGLYAGLSDRGDPALAHGLERRTIHDGLPGHSRSP